MTCPICGGTMGHYGDCRWRRMSSDERLTYLGMGRMGDEASVVWMVASDLRRERREAERERDEARADLASAWTPSDAAHMEALVQRDEARARVAELEAALRHMVDAAHVLDRDVWRGHSCNRCRLPDPPDGECMMVRAAEEARRVLDTGGTHGE